MSERADHRSSRAHPGRDTITAGAAGASAPRRDRPIAGMLARHLARPRELARLLVLGEIVGERPARGPAPSPARAPGRPPRRR